MAKRDEQNGKRRFFSAEFKLEAVRWMRELGAAPVSLSQVDRELGVRPDMLYARARLALALADEGGHGAAGLIALARKDATQLIREQLPWTIALGQLVLACAASFI